MESGVPPVKLLRSPSTGARWPRPGHLSYTLLLVGCVSIGNGKNGGIHHAHRTFCLIDDRGVEFRA